MTEVVPCLLRVGENLKKYRIFKLDRDQVTIGRSGEVTYAILSNMISRCHAVIDRRQDGSWDLTDKKSLNGIYVNGRQLVPFEAYTMQEGDLIQLGVATSPDAPAEFIYKFHSALKVRIEKKGNKRLKTEISSQKDTLSASENIESESETELKRKKPKEQEEAGDSMSKVLREQMEQAQKEQALKEAEYQARLAQMEKLLKEKEDRQMEVQQQLEKERQEKESQAKEVEELRQKEQAILQEMQDKQDELEKEREQLKQKMQEELEANLKDREQTLKSQLSAQREALLNEKKQVEENLQKEMEKALEEKNKELEKELQEQKKKLEQVIEKKELEQKILESQLNETKEESATAKMQALKARDDVLSNFVDLMEMELQCTICNELFIKATSLNCAHVFCKLCINQWMKVKKECPNCRTPITSQMQALALDSYIDRMVENLNDDLKQRRAELLEIRKVEQMKFDGVKAGPSTSIASAVAGSSGGVVAPGRAPQGAASSSTTATTSSNSSTSTVRTSSRISQRRARTRGGRANATAATRPAVSTTASVTRAVPSASVEEATGPMAAPTEASRLVWLVHSFTPCC
ncbi:E3 ubiquitin-protein ligase RNF8 [Elysia marginata]|uniref:E3 ubiquitin-protein ligase CHFR n=1 Tax=Elysia marginata TaxID=1093978 RepID=A0AAV4IEF1_9GAST|nr:E3 ubiquitin-protein ligase RNF8 [Elysia marginata]